MVNDALMLVAEFTHRFMPNDIPAFNVVSNRVASAVNLPCACGSSGHRFDQRFFYPIG